MYTRFFPVPMMDSAWHALPCSPLLFVPRRHLTKHTVLHVKSHQKRLQLRQHSPTGLLTSWTHTPRHRIHTSTRATADDGYKDEYCEPERNLEYWNTRPIVVTQRALEVGLRFGRWLLESRLAARGTTADLEAVRAAKLREVLIDLGPAFVKIGQAISSRPDAVPPMYIRELEKLQDRIPPFSNDDAMRTLANELGTPVDVLFSDMSDAPIAAASLGQVYKARLRATGQQVAVKVQRPGVASAIGLDTYILRFAAAWFKHWRKLNSDLPALIDEWTASLFRELDYRNEAANGVRFRELYGNVEGVYVPEMLLNLTTRRVLVMEWVVGERLRSASDGVPGVQGQQGTRGSAEDLALVDVGVRCSLEQMLEEGFYHADPHPGNLLRLPNGKLAYLDFGMMGSVDPSIRRGLIRATLHLTNREYAALADDFITLGFLPTGSNKAEIVPALTGVFQAALAGGVSNLSFGDLSSNLGATMYKYQFRIPPYYTLLVRSLSMLEGIALSSEPGYKVLRAAYPWVARRLLTDQSPELRETLLALLYKNGRFQFVRCESLLREAIKSPARGTRGAAASGRADIPPPSSATARGDALALLLSPEGGFIREIVVEELSKGLDAAWRVGTDRAVTVASDSLRSLLQMREQLPLRGAVTEQVLRGVQQVPVLSDEEDVEQIEGLMRLARLLGVSAGLQEDVAAAPARTLQSTTKLLQWLATESQSLNEQQRAQALSLPLAIATKVSSRAVARGIRLLFADTRGREAMREQQENEEEKKPGEKKQGEKEQVTQRQLASSGGGVRGVLATRDGGQVKQLPAVSSTAATARAAAVGALPVATPVPASSSPSSTSTASSSANSAVSGGVALDTTMTSTTQPPMQTTTTTSSASTAITMQDLAPPSTPHSEEMMVVEVAQKAAPVGEMEVVVPDEVLPPPSRMGAAVQ